MLMLKTSKKEAGEFLDDWLWIFGSSGFASWLPLRSLWTTGIVEVGASQLVSSHQHASPHPSDPRPPIPLPIATSASPLHHPPYQDAFTDSHRRLFHVHISLERHFHMRQNIRTRTNIIVVILKLFISTVQTFGEF